MIAFPHYATRIDCIPIKANSFDGYDDIVIARRFVPNAYNILWGENMETGFFWDGIHIDSNGIYGKSSFNLPGAIEEVEKLDKPSVIDKILAMKVPSKYRQTNYDVDWNGVVLASQNPTDRSVNATGKDWYEFYEGACKFYGSRLFVKLHPWNCGEVGEKICEIAKRYGCRFEKTNHSCIRHCEFVLTFCSSFCVDCFLRDVPVAQYAPGYFYKTPAVTYTDGTYPTSVKRTDWGRKLVDFLAYKYCFNMKMPFEKWVSLIRHYASSKELFPMNDEWCYANTIKEYV